MYKEEGLVAQAERLGAVLAREMERFRDLPGVQRVRGLGMIAALDLDDGLRAQAVRDRLLAQGILLRPLGPVLYLMPPLMIGEDVLVKLVADVYLAIQDTGRT